MSYIHADKGGVVSQNGNAFYTLGRVWINSQDARNNSTNFTVELLQGTNVTSSQWADTVRNKFCRMDGAYRYPGEHYQNNAPWGNNPCQLFAETYDVQHDGNGNRWINLWLYAYAGANGWGPGDCRVVDGGNAWDVSLPQIDRTGMVMTISPSAITKTSVNINRYWGKDADLCQYTINGSGWIDEWTHYGNIYFDGNNISGLTPNTAYSIRVRMRRTHNWVWSESNTITIKTHPNDVTMSTLVATATDPFTVTVSATTNSPSTTEKIIVNCNGTNKQINGGSGTVTFTVNPDTTYTVKATSYTLRSGTTNVKTTTVTTPADSYCYVIEPSGTVSTKKKMYLINTNGVKTEIKKQNVTVL